MDIKSWILLVGTLLIIAVICHGFWTAYRARKNDVRMDIETDVPEDELDDMALLSGELPNGGARVTPTVGYDALRVKERLPVTTDTTTPFGDSAAYPAMDPLDDALIALDDAVAFAEEGLASDRNTPDEGNADAGYQPEQATLDLEMGALEERYAARAAAAALDSSTARATAPLLTDTALDGEAQTLTQGLDEESVAALPPKKLITPEVAVQPPRKQFEPPFPEELEAQRNAEQELEAQKLKEQLEATRIEEQAAREKVEREAAYQAKVEAQRVRKAEQDQREAQAKIDAQARAEARLRAKEDARIHAEALAQKEAQREAQREAHKEAQQRAQEKAQREAQSISSVRQEPEQLNLTSEPVVEFPETPRMREVERSGGARQQTRSNAQDNPVRQTPSQPPVEELVVLNVIAKTRPFHGGDVLELFLRNGIKFGDMNIFHRIDPVSRASQYSIASVTEPGFFDLRTMETLEFRGLCLFMQLPCSGQATKVFTDMLTVADKLARQLDAEVCDEQFNRLTRQSTEHYRQRVAEFTRRHMSKRA